MDSEERRKLVNNERLKLLATFVNGMGLGVFVVGALAPVVSNLYQLNDLGGAATFALVVCFLAAWSLHYLASTILRGLRP